LLAKLPTQLTLKYGNAKVQYKVQIAHRPNKSWGRNVSLFLKMQNLYPRNESNGLKQIHANQNKNEKKVSLFVWGNNQFPAKTI